MKQNRNAFTLIELMVVIAIVAILAAIMAAAVGGAMARADKATAQSMVQSIKTAIDSYKTEYGTWPIVTGSGQELHGGPDIIISNLAESKIMYAILTAYDYEKEGDVEGVASRYLKNYPKQFNGRSLTFMTLEGEDYENLLPTDPWNNQYLVALDNDYDGLIKLRYNGSNQYVRAGCIVLSLGPLGTSSSSSSGWPSASGKNGGIYSYDFGD